MEIMRFYKQKRILHKYVRWMYDLLADGRFYNLRRAKNIKDLPISWKYGDPEVPYFKKMYHCADEFYGVMDEHTGSHKIQRGYFCKDRICPVCAIKKSLWEYSKLTWQMEHFQEDYTYYFLSLTLPDNPDGFRKEIDLMSSCLTELGEYLGYNCKTGCNNICSGMYGSYEITKSDEYGWHPHLHLVIAYPSKFVVSTNTVTKYIKGRKRVFENGLNLKGNKGKTLFLSQDLIMQKYIDLVKARTHEYDERLSDLNFFDIGFQPCYNISDGVNEMSKYLIDFEALQSAEDLYIYMQESYNLRQRVRRGIFRWTPELKAAHRLFLKNLKEEENKCFIQSEEGVKKEGVKKYHFKWEYGSYIAFRFYWRVRKIPFSSKRDKVLCMRIYELEPLYDSDGNFIKYDLYRLPDKIFRDRTCDIDYVDDLETVQIGFT